MIAHVQECIRRAEAGEGRLPESVRTIPGMTGDKVRTFLNELCSPDGWRHLEVGTFKGATLIAASHGNPGHFVGIDNFSQFEGEEARAALHDNLEAHPHPDRLFVEADCFSPEAAKTAVLRGPFDSFFYDGQHGGDSTQRALEHHLGAMASPFVFVIDDSKTEDVARSWESAKSHSPIRVLWETELRPVKDMHREWWWGLFVAVCEVVKC